MFFFFCLINTRMKATFTFDLQFADHLIDDAMKNPGLTQVSTSSFFISVTWLRIKRRMAQSVILLVCGSRFDFFLSRFNLEAIFRKNQDWSFAHAIILDSFGISINFYRLLDVLRPWSDINWYALENFRFGYRRFLMHFVALPIKLKLHFQLF